MQDQKFNAETQRKQKREQQSDKSQKDDFERHFRTANDIDTLRPRETRRNALLLSLSLSSLFASSASLR
jgi:hypothetical protein